MNHDFKQQAQKDWFDKAEKDMRRLDALLAISDVEGAGFHLQQAAEKYLK